MNNRIIKITLDKPLKLYSSLKFEEKGLTYLKEGISVNLEETGKIYVDKDGKVYNILRFRKNTRNYYVLDVFNR